MRGFSVLSVQKQYRPQVTHSPAERPLPPAEESRIIAVSSSSTTSGSSASSPHADHLVLIGQLLPVAVVVVVALDGPGGGAEVVLGATLRSQVGVVARVLADLRAH